MSVERGAKDWEEAREPKSAEIAIHDLKPQTKHSLLPLEQSGANLYKGDDDGEIAHLYGVEDAEEGFFEATFVDLLVDSPRASQDEVHDNR